MNEAVQNLLTRRSIRSYKNTPISDELLDEVLRIGLTAPSARNLQPWHVSVVRKPEDIERMMDTIRDFHRSHGNAAMADDPGFHTFYHAPVVLYISSEDENVKYGLSDSANLTTYLTLAAHALGLATCYIASSNVLFEGEHAEEMRKLLQIPNGFTPRFSLALGYADGETPAMKERRADTVSYAD